MALLADAFAAEAPLVRNIRSLETQAVSETGFSVIDSSQNASGGATAAAGAGGADGEALAEPATAAPRMLGVSADDVRPEDQLTVSFFGAPLTLGGEVEGGFQSQANYDFDDGADDFRLRALPEVKLEAFYQPADNFVIFAQTKGFIESELVDKDGSKETDRGASLDQAWALWSHDIGGGEIAVQAGRQQFQDRREWWWDDDLEAVRLRFARGRLSGFFAVAEKLWSTSTLEPLEPDERDIRRFFANAVYAFERRRQAEIFLMRQNDHSSTYRMGDAILEDDFDEADSDLTWVGVRYRGRHKIDGVGKLYFTLDGALVRGNEVEIDSTEANGVVSVTRPVKRRVKGAAFDGSLSWELPVEWEPILSFGYTIGSGDDTPDDGHDGDFRQTGLHGNNGKFRGISRFRYYGEALRPDLTNIRILTAAFGAPIGESVWVEMVLHDYKQQSARGEIPGSRLDLDPTGLSRKLGREFDLIVSYEQPSRKWEAELSAGAFRAGEAFGAEQGEWALVVAVKINHNF